MFGLVFWVRLTVGLGVLVGVLESCGVVVFVLILSFSLCVGFRGLLFRVGRLGVDLAILLVAFVLMHLVLGV